MATMPDTIIVRVKARIEPTPGLPLRARLLLAWRLLANR